MGVATRAGPLRIGQLSPVRTVDPMEAMDRSSGLASDQIFETIYRHTGAEARPEPVLLRERLAVERMTGGAMQFHGRIRPDARFSDGTPLTPAIAAAVLARVSALVELAEVRDVREHLVFVPRRGVTRERLERELCKRWTALVLRKDGGLLGTGSYMLADPVGATPYVRLVANPHARRPPKIAEVDLLAFADQNELAAAMKAGRVDFTTELSRERVATLGGVGKRFVHGTGTAILFFNVERPALAEARVRARLAAAIDVRALSEAAFGDAIAFATPSLLPPSFGMPRPPKAAAPAPDTELPHSTAGPSRLRLLTMWGPRPYLPDPLATSQAIAHRFAALGVETEVHSTRNAQDAVERLIARDYDVFVGGWMADGPDPSDFLFALLSSSCIPAPGVPVGLACNLARWRNDQVDDALGHYRRTGDRDALARILALVDDEVPLVPLMCGPTIVVHGWHVTPGAIGPGPPDLAEFSREST